MGERRQTAAARDEHCEPVDQPTPAESPTAPPCPEPAQATPPGPRAGERPPYMAPPPVEPPAHHAGVEDPAVAAGVRPDPARQGQQREPSQNLSAILDLRDRMDRYEQTLQQLQATLTQNQQQIAEAKNQLQVIAQHENVDLNMLRTP